MGMEAAASYLGITAITFRFRRKRGKRNRRDSLGKFMLTNTASLSHQDSGARRQLGDGGGEHSGQSGSVSLKMDQVYIEKVRGGDGDGVT